MAEMSKPDGWIFQSRRGAHWALRGTERSQRYATLAEVIQELSARADGWMVVGVGTGHWQGVNAASGAMTGHHTSAAAAWEAVQARRRDGQA